jgi:hypothetical protein
VGVRGERGKFYEGLVESLIAFAESEFKSAKKRPDGATEGEHAASAAAQWARLGRKQKTTDIEAGPDCPAALNYLWFWFCQHCFGLSSGGMGVPVVTWEGLHSWACLSKVEMEPWEALTMVRLGHLRAIISSETAPGAA